MRSETDKLSCKITPMYFIEVTILNELKPNNVTNSMKSNNIALRWFEQKCFMSTSVWQSIQRVLQ